MSLEQAKLFIERMKTDDAFREKIMATEDLAGRLRLANAEGYDCTEEEIRQVAQEFADAEVAGVAAGGATGEAPGGWFPCHCKGYTDCRLNYRAGEMSCG